MQTIICPHCKKEFEIDESSYNSIVSQIRNEEFSKELHERLSLLEKEKEKEVKLAVSEESNKKDKIIHEKERELDKLKAENDAEILKLRNELKNKDTERELAIKTEQEKLTSEIFTLKNAYERAQSQNAIEQGKLKSEHEIELKKKDDEIAYYKDLKIKQSTKMIGEDLERHCENEFNRVRAMGFKNATFEKDNRVSESGSKGDYIFRDFSDDRTEFVSIMFEMKNQSDSPSAKHKNEEFFKELDKDRREKGCEYAVLVSLLEPENDFYNDGIVDVSHKYEKMYVIRPQFFIPMITLIRNAALNTVSYRKELAVIREQNLDITKFEEQFNEFRTAFGKNYTAASDKFQKAIEEIDKTITQLNKIKAALTSSENQLRLATNKVENMDMNKLLKNSPTLKKQYQATKK